MLKRFVNIVFLLLFPFMVFSENLTNNQQVQLKLREIGNQFLKSIGDSTSLVLPIEKNEGRYALKFNRNLSFEPSMLSELVEDVLLSESLDSNILVEVESCDSSIVVHSFQLNKKIKSNEIACIGRYLPESCYVFYFSGLKFLPIIDQNSTREESYYMLVFLVLFGSILVFSFYFFVNRKKKFNGISIGQFTFDPKRLILNLDAESIELSVKEADLLFLLHKHENETLERAFILNQIWGDEGDYVGRTLDVFVSKLRKKIAADSSLQIVNVRGVGYRFVVD